MTGEVELVARCRAGDRAAWKLLHDGYFEFVWKVAARLGTPDDELDDVVQEAFLIAFRKLDRFERGQLRTWLYQITAHVVSGRHRRRRVLRTLRSLLAFGAPEPIIRRTPHHDAEAHEAEALVQRVLEKMSPRKREVFVLYEIEGLSGEEIARRIARPLDTVWSRLHHARKDFERIAGKRGFLS